MAQVIMGCINVCFKDTSWIGDRLDISFPSLLLSIVPWNEVTNTSEFFLDLKF